MIHYIYSLAAAAYIIVETESRSQNLLVIFKSCMMIPAYLFIAKFVTV